MGGEALKDDHGDDWETATYISPESQTQAIESWLEEEDDVDVFAFELTASLFVILYTLGPGDTDTFGTLYQIKGNKEVEIAFDDNGSSNNGFMIKKHLTPGIYTVHVKGKIKRTTGAYNFYYGGE